MAIRFRTVMQLFVIGLVVAKGGHYFLLSSNPIPVVLPITFFIPVPFHTRDNGHYLGLYIQLVDSTQFVTLNDDGTSQTVICVGMYEFTTTVLMLTSVWCSDRSTMFPIVQKIEVSSFTVNVFPKAPIACVEKIWNSTFVGPWCPITIHRQQGGIQTWRRTLMLGSQNMTIRTAMTIVNSLS